MYKLGAIKGDKKVVDVKRVWHPSLLKVMQQTEELREQGYVLDIASVRDVGIQKQMNMVKFEDIVLSETTAVVNKDNNIIVNATEEKTEDVVVEEVSEDTVVASDVDTTEDVVEQDNAVNVEEAVVEVKTTKSKTSKK